MSFWSISNSYHRFSLTSCASVTVLLAASCQKCVIFNQPSEVRIEEKANYQVGLVPSGWRVKKKIPLKQRPPLALAGIIMRRGFGYSNVVAGTKINVSRSITRQSSNSERRNIYYRTWLYLLPLWKRKERKISVFHSRSNYSLNFRRREIFQ